MKKKPVTKRQTVKFHLCKVTKFVKIIESKSKMFVAPE